MYTANVVVAENMLKVWKRVLAFEDSYWAKYEDDLDAYDNAAGDT